MNKKKDILREYQNCKSFKEVLHFLLNPHIITGISNKKISKAINIAEQQYFKQSLSFIELLNYLKQNNTGRDIDIVVCQGCIHNYSNPELQEFIKSIITKSYKLGIDAKTVNKIYGKDFIPTWEVQLGSPYDKLKLKPNEYFYLSRKLNGCFDGNTKITMGDNTYKKIKNIVIGDIVASFDENTKEISNKKVINIFDNGLKELDEWVQINSSLERGTNKDYVLTTKNHLFFTDNGWKRVGDLRVGDTYYIRDYELSETQKSVLLGIGLGDGNVMFDNKDIKTVRFNYPKKISEYQDYLHKTCELFDIYQGVYIHRKSGYGTSMEQGNIKTIYNIPEYFTNQKNILRMGYTFTDEILQNITPLTLAIYYIDDGSKLPCKLDGNVYATNVKPRITLATHRHDKSDVDRFQKYLYERYSVNSRVVQYQPCYENAGYQIEIDEDGTYKFFDIIAKFIPINIRNQKLSKPWHNVEFDDWTNNIGQYKLVKRKVEEINVGDDIPMFKNTKRKSNRAYDIEVEDNHTYFANGFAVHNCRTSFVDGKLISRQGKEFQGLQHVINDINACGLQDYFIDGELIRKNIDDISDGENFRIGTGIINSDDSDKLSIKLVIFDIFSSSELQDKQSKDTYKQRKQNLLKLKEQIKINHLENIDVVEMVYEGTDKSQIDTWLQYAVDNDWEGLMLNKDTVYKCKRTTDLIKIKRFYTMDLKVIAVEEGIGRLCGTLGALVVNYKGNTVNVGSGFDDETRSKIWKNKEDIIDKIIEVKYKEITKDKKTGLESLQFPIFVQIRNDKIEESYN